MGIYLYCIGDADLAPPDGAAGVDGAPVFSVRVDSFQVWASAVAAPPEPSVPRIRRHDAVVRSATRSGPAVLPVRFGQWLASRAGLDERIGANREAYRDALRRVDGAVEMSLRVHDPEQRPDHDHPAPSGRGGGREYLEAAARRIARARARDRRGEELAVAIRDALGDLVRAEARQPPATPREIVSFAHLVHRDDLDEYGARLYPFRRDSHPMRFLSSGPWPPYSFAS